MHKLYQKFLSYASKIALRDLYLWYLTSIGIGIGLAVAEIYWFTIVLFMGFILGLLFLFFKYNPHCLHSPHQVIIMLILLLIGFMLMSLRLQHFAAQMPQEKFWYQVKGQVGQVRQYDSDSLWLVLNRISVRATRTAPTWQKLGEVFSLRIFIKATSTKETALSTSTKSTSVKSTSVKSTSTKSTSVKSTSAKSTSAKSTSVKSTSTKSTSTKSTSAKSVTSLWTTNVSPKDMRSIQPSDWLIINRVRLNHWYAKYKQDPHINIYDLMPSTFARISAKQITSIESAVPAHINFWYQRVKEQTSFMSSASQAFIQAILTGQRQSSGFQDLIKILRPSGLGHIIAISGLHMSLLANFVFWLVLWIVSYFSCIYLHFSLRKVSAWVGLGICFLYLMFTGFPLTAQRAFLMIGLAFLAIVLDRQIRGIRTLSLGGLIFLLLWPEYLLHIGLQFSFMSVLILLCLYEDYQKKSFTKQISNIHNHNEEIPYLAWICLVLYANLLLSLAVNLIQIYHFSVIYPYAVLNNSLILPIFTLIIMPLIFLSIPLILLGLAFPILYVIDWLLQYLLNIIGWMTSLPLSIITVQWSVEAWLLVFLGFYCCFLFKRITYKPILIVFFAGSLMYLL